MTELLVTPKSLSHMETLIDLGADAFVIGEQKFGLRLPGEFNRQQMTEAVALAHKNDKKVYAAVNGLFHNYHLDAVEDYINFLHEIRVDRIIFGILESNVCEGARKSNTTSLECRDVSN